MTATPARTAAPSLAQPATIATTDLTAVLAACPRAVPRAIRMRAREAQADKLVQALVSVNQLAGD